MPLSGRGGPRTIVAACGDAGGARALAPVLQALRDERRVAVRAFAYAQGVDVLTDSGVPVEALREEPSPAFLAGALAHGDAAAVLCATSVNDYNWEQAFVRGARAFGVPSMALLDFWTNYRGRFSDRAGNLVAVPDVIAVPDERAAAGLRHHGVTADIVVTGQPALDDLAAARSVMTRERRDTIRRTVAVGGDDLLVLFASQPFAALRGTLEDMGYDEEQVLDLVMPALEQVACALSPRSITLVLRPHPRESAAPLAPRRSSVVNVVIAADNAGREWAMAADLVIGMCTHLLVEASYLGATVLSVQPGLRVPDPVPTNAIGLSTAVYTAAEVGPAIDRLVRAAADGASPPSVVGLTAATPRVVDAVYSLIAKRGRSGQPIHEYRHS